MPEAIIAALARRGSSTPAVRRQGPAGQSARFRPSAANVSSVVNVRFFNAQQRHGRPAVAPMLRRRNETFGVPEGIQRPDQRRALAGIIVQVQQREARHSWACGGGSRFPLCRAARHAGPVACTNCGARSSKCFFQVVADQLEILGLRARRCISLSRRNWGRTSTGRFRGRSAAGPAGQIARGNRRRSAGRGCREGPLSVYCRLAVTCPAEAEE